MKKRFTFLSAILCVCLLCSAFAFTGCGEKYSVTFNLNYTGAPEATVLEVTSGEKADEPQAPVREGYEFDGWAKDAAGTEAYGFDSPVKGNVTLYAKWKEDASYASVTFSLGYEGAENVVVKVKKGQRVAEQKPSRAGYELINWYKEESLTNKYNFALTVNDNMTLYAMWKTQFTFEAEYCDCIRDQEGPGWSGTVGGVSMIVQDKFKSASNGFFVSYFYKNNMYLKFTITSDKADKHARLNLRLSTQYIDINLTDTLFAVNVGNTSYGFTPIAIQHHAGDLTNTGMTPFADFFISEIELKEGDNEIVLRVTNSQANPGSTLQAAAPVFDCIKITTDSKLTWTKDYNGKNLEDAGFIV